MDQKKNYRCTDGGIQPNEHRPTEKTKAKVEAMVMAGFTQEQIMNYLQISINTLYKHYRKELDNTMPDRTMALSDLLYKDALGGDKQCREFWLKHRAKWVMAKPAEEKDRDDKILTLLEMMANKL